MKFLGWVVSSMSEIRFKIYDEYSFSVLSFFSVLCVGFLPREDIFLRYQSCLICCIFGKESMSVCDRVPKLLLIDYIKFICEPVNKTRGF